MTRPTESQVRLIRQFLLAREQRRAGDARLIWDALLGAGLRLTHVRRRDVARGFLDYWQVPASADELVVLEDCGREPVFRIPRDHGSRLASEFEVPAEVPPGLEAAVRVPDGSPVIEVAGSGRFAALKRVFGW